MKTILMMFLLSGSFLLLNCASGKEPEWKNFDKGIAKSKADKKMMVVSVYTDWCSWCKKMESQTYKDKQVLDYINEKYIPIKLNAEENTKLTFNEITYTNPKFVRDFGISAYPATIFFDEQQQPLTVVPGYIPANEFIKILKYFGEGEYKSKSYDEFVKNYN